MMFISAHYHESRSREIGFRYSPKRSPNGLFNRRDRFKNWSPSQHCLEICFRTRKGRKNQDFEKRRASQNVCCCHHKITEILTEKAQSGEENKSIKSLNVRDSEMVQLRKKALITVNQLGKYVQRNIRGGREYTAN